MLWISILSARLLRICNTGATRTSLISSCHNFYLASGMSRALVNRIAHTTERALCSYSLFRRAGQEFGADTIWPSEPWLCCGEGILAFYASMSYCSLKAISYCAVFWALDPPASVTLLKECYVEAQAVAKSCRVSCRKLFTASKHPPKPGDPRLAPCVLHNPPH